MLKHGNKYPYITVFVLLVCLHVFPPVLFAQSKNVLQYVNPFIGTAKSNVYTRWGNEGGTYPGAVAPWGYMQLSPETRSTGYDYKDNSIRFFSCSQHHSGFPGGSAGRLHIMPVIGTYKDDCSRRFLHKDEVAKPGYYKVLFRDNNTLIEATATTHCGLFRLTFPPHIIPCIFIDDCGELSMQSSNILHGSRMNTIIHFDKAMADTQKVADGYLVSFSPAASGNTILSIQLSSSSVSYENSQQNIDAELSGKSFEEVRDNTQQEWKKELSVVSISDSSKENKTIFYTALYHSLLLPWIISDVAGKYKGADNLIHTTKGKNEHGGFSPWDTFRSLHPLLSLLYPDKQTDMLLSMFDIYEQSGYLPIESMTGNHSIPILVDSYLKGIRPIDSLMLYKAMKKSIVDGPFLQPDMSLYQQGFIPYPHTESVTRTVEYTYDDWALAQYAKEVMYDDSMYRMLSKRSRSYQNLFAEDELSLIPKKDKILYHGTANAGYKEGDQWVYTLFLPHYQQSLINLFGGDENFIQNLDKEWLDKRLVFDNETMFHVPYLFNSTKYSYKTQQWVHAIIQRFSNTPGGLPGNDDLGSTSSWFVWSALGFYPVCPGNPVYAIGAPLFREVNLFLPAQKQLHIQADNISVNNFYVKDIKRNGKLFTDKWLSHNDVIQGGELLFTMDNKANKTENKGVINGETDSAMNIHISDVFVQKKEVKQDEPFWIPFTVNNNGASGTAVIKLFVNDSISFYKNCFVKSNETRKDSILCKLYTIGNNKLQIDNVSSFSIQVRKTNTNNSQPQIMNVQVSPLTKQGTKLYYNYAVKNVGGEAKQFVISVKLANTILRYDTVQLKPGDSVIINHNLTAKENGWYQLSVFNQSSKGKVYRNVTDAIVLNILEEITNQNEVKDKSGFGNNGNKSIFGNYIELPHSASLDSNGTALTMMEWIYDTGTNKPLTELMAKGDNHVLQLVDGKSLTFFAGGWGRGDCTVSLPNNWRNNWHQIAGVCNGKDLRVYIDGELKGITPLEEIINLNVAARWTIGSNEEFPLDRTFGGKIKGVKIFAAPLSAEDIKSIYTNEKQNY